MVGLVLVSHSKALVEAALTLVKELSPIPIPIAGAGGVGENKRELGTDATDILEAIKEVFSEDGVLILADMGSAILSSEFALELLDSLEAKKVKICPAPIIEGAVAAAVQIGLNRSLEDVDKEARLGLSAKEEHLLPHSFPEKEDNKSFLQVDFETNPQVISRVFKVKNQHGLHARPISRLIQTAAQFSAKIGVKNITKNTTIADAESLIALGRLQAEKNDEIMFFALGEDAIQSLDALEALHNTNYGDKDFVELIEKRVESNQFAISQGYAIGPAIIVNETDVVIEKITISNPYTEITRLKEAIKNAVNQLTNEISIHNNCDTDIFKAHLLMLTDPMLIDFAEKMIESELCNADYAWHTAIQTISQEYQAMENSYFKMRAADLIDIGKRVLYTLGAISQKDSISFDKEGIVFIGELLPSMAALLNPNIIKAVVTEFGGMTSHAAIITRSLGIPLISGFADWKKIKNGTPVIVDGYTSELYFNPNEELLKQYTAKYNQWKKDFYDLKQKAQTPAFTQDGQQITVLSNIGSLSDAQSVGESGADGVGLLRTEFLFLNRKKAPTETEQYIALRDILTVIDKPITLRTLDIGGDKPLPYLHREREDNPFLGVRGVRLYKTEPELFSIHIRAVLRAAFNTNTKLMFPMIAQINEFEAVKNQVIAVHNQLENEGIAHLWPIEIGVMIETPAAALIAQELAQKVDFFSIGTNDLTQYIMAAERGNKQLSEYSDPMSLPLLRALALIIESGKASNIPVSLCGELGVLKPSLSILLSLGLTTISLTGASIPEAKNIIRELNFAQLSKQKNSLLGGTNLHLYKK